MEAKSDSEATHPDTVAKRELAEEWAAAVREARIFGVWRYLFVTESAIKAAPSWDALVSAK